MLTQKKSNVIYVGEFEPRLFRRYLGMAWVNQIDHFRSIFHQHSADVLSEEGRERERDTKKGKNMEVKLVVKNLCFCLITIL